MAAAGTRVLFLGILTLALTCVDFPPLEDADDPPASRIRFRADSWADLVRISRPSAVHEQAYLLWCRPHPKGWTFEVASPWILTPGNRKVWAVLDSQEPWPGGDIDGALLQGSCVSAVGVYGDGPQASARCVGKSSSWGALYQIRVPTVPGGNHANYEWRTLLAWLRPEGTWTILWAGRETPGWSLGSDGVSDTVEFQVASLETATRSPRITVTRTIYLYPSFEDDLDLHPPLEFRRDGVLSESGPAELRWSAPWTHVLGRPESLESLAQEMEYYGGSAPKSIARLRHLNANADREWFATGTTLRITWSDDPLYGP
jgi:hypothetical protein